MNQVPDTVLTDDDCRLWVTETGSGAPLILCHGGPGLWDMFGDLAAVLAANVSVIRWDQRGCGRSERRGPYSLARSVADLEAVRRHLAVEQVAVLGHSWGAQLALRYALGHPDRVSDLIYVSGVGLGWSWHEPFEQNLAKRLAPHKQRITALESHDRDEAEDREWATLQWSAEFTDRREAMRHAGQMATPWLGINYECSATINAELKRSWHEPDLMAACQGLQVLTLIIDGAADIRPRWAVDSLEQALPMVTRAEMTTAGHVPWLDAPGEFSSVLLEYLSRPRELRA